MSTTHTLSSNDLLLINSALLAFENPPEKLVDNRPVRQPYDLSPKARYCLMRNLKRVKPVMEKISDDRESLRITFNPGNLRLPELSPEKQAAWDAEHRKLMAEKQAPIQFHTCNLSEFNLEKNLGLPSSVIATLLSYIIIDDAPQDEVV